MLGAITGDIVGSIYEGHNHKSKDFPFFSQGCTFTDDTVSKPCVVAKVEWYSWELVPRVGFIVTNLSRPGDGKAWRMKLDYPPTGPVGETLGAIPKTP